MAADLACESVAQASSSRRCPNPGRNPRRPQTEHRRIRRGALWPDRSQGLHCLLAQVQQHALA